MVLRRSRTAGPEDMFEVEVAYATAESCLIRGTIESLVPVFTVPSCTSATWVTQSGISSWVLSPRITRGFLGLVKFV
ncbi:hypothetical protein Ac2012v2_008266 [Leucoagaricus gongylophorus]